MALVFTHCSVRDRIGLQITPLPMTKDQGGTWREHSRPGTRQPVCLDPPLWGEWTQ